MAFLYMKYGVYQFEIFYYRQVQLNNITYDIVFSFIVLSSYHMISYDSYTKQNTLFCSKYAIHDAPQLISGFTLWLSIHVQNAPKTAVWVVSHGFIGHFIND